MFIQLINISWPRALVLAFVENGEVHEYSILWVLLSRLPGVGQDFATHVPDHLLMAFFVMVVLVLFSLCIRSRLSLEDPGRIQILLETIIGWVRDLAQQMIGDKAERYIPFLATYAIFILCCNLVGLVPGLQPPTTNLNMTASLMVVAVVFYHYHGIRTKGIGRYLKAMTGGFTLGDSGELSGFLKVFLFVIFYCVLPVIFFSVELMDHFVARPLSLSIRLFGSMFGEHTATMVFADLAPYVVPIVMYLFGIIGGVVQTFIFVLLTMFYLRGAVSEHH